jgi:hypothetical protein
MLESYNDWEENSSKIKELKKQELSKYTINGHKVIGIYGIESVGEGFELENNDVILINTLGDADRSVDTIYLYRIEDPEWGYDEVKRQSCGSNYDLERAYNIYIKYNEQPIFNTKIDAKTFLYLCNKEFSKHEGYEKMKIKLDYIYTLDMKPKKVIIPSENTLNNYKGLKINIDGEFFISEIELKNTFDDYYQLSISFEMVDKQEKTVLDIFNSVSYHLLISINIDIFGTISFKPYLSKNVGFSKTEEIKKIPDTIKGLTKGLKKLFTK